MADEKEIIKAVVQLERTRFYRDQFGIVVCSIQEMKSGQLHEGVVKDNVVFKGPMADPIIGEWYNVTAEYTDDTRWGGEYRIINIALHTIFKTNDKEGQKRYLMSLFTPSQIEALYDALPDPFDTFINHRAEDLVQVNGVAMKRATEWMERFDRNYYKAKIFTELDNYNLTDRMVDKLMGTYHNPDIIVEKIRNNPYILSYEVTGIGFRRADEIARKSGIGKYDIRRISAYIMCYLQERNENGCSWVLCDELLGAILDELGEDISDETITMALRSIDKKLWTNEEQTRIGLRSAYNTENAVAENLIRLRDAKSYIVYKNWEEKIAKLEEQQGWRFADEQKEGIKLALDNNVVVIAGLAGSGKSSLVSGILAVLNHYTFVQTALAGRAAARLSEVTGAEGFTIHRLLGYNLAVEEHQHFGYNEDNQLSQDIFIIDEISMISAQLFYYLLRAIPDGAKVIMLGDPGQLESIGMGNVAYDMIQSPQIPTVELTQIHRQGKKSAIITNSIQARHGQQLIEEGWVGDEVRGELQDLALHCYSDASNTYHKIVGLFKEYMKKPDFNIMETQVIVPMKERGDACTYRLNAKLQALYNPPSDSKQQVILWPNTNHSFIIRQGDKVINTVNNYRVKPNVYNGNIGIVKNFGYNTKQDYVMRVAFEGIGTLELTKKDWDKLQLGYAITVHKYQGSESDYIIFGFDYKAYTLLSRQLVYTGITRAKKRCELVAQNSALKYAVSHEEVSKKQTHLQRCLYEIVHPKLVF